MTKSLFAHGKAILCVSFVNWTQLLFILVSGRSFFFFFSILRALVVHFCCYSWDFFFFSFKEIQWLRHTSPVSQTDLLCMHSPSVQFLDCRTRPSQSLPPFLGAGAVHSLLRQWVHSVPQVDHLLHEVHLPSTATKKKKKKQQQVKERRSFLKAERGQGSSRNKTPNTEENAPPRSAAFILTATSSTCSPYFLWILQTFLTRGLWLFLHWPCTGTLMGHTEIKVVTRSYIKVNPSSVPFSILGFGLKIRGPPYGSNIPWIVHVISASKLLWG